jgi:hypothetical protein
LELAVSVAVLPATSFAVALEVNVPTSGDESTPDR